MDSKKRIYLDIHILQTVPPSCVNRDDTTRAAPRPRGTAELRGPECRARRGKGPSG